MPNLIEGHDSSPNPRQPIRSPGRVPFLLSCMLWIAIAVIATGIGAVHISPVQIVRMLAHRIGVFVVEADWPRSHEVILYQLRLPRIFLGGLVGAALSVSGAALQGLFRNPMAGPFTLGISSGAAVGAVIAMVFGEKISWLGVSSVPATAFFVAMVTIVVVYTVARSGERIATATLLLAGVAISSFLSAVVSLILVFDEERVGMIVFWLMGGLGRADWQAIAAVLPFFLIGATMTVLYARDLNAMLLGEESAYHLGVGVERIKRRLLFAVSLMTAAAVSVSGIIGFVGMIIPHVIRLWTGPDHRMLIPLAALGGGMFLMVTDTVARTVISPAEIPVGVITALCGAPFFVWMLRKAKKGWNL